MSALRNPFQYLRLPRGEFKKIIEICQNNCIYFYLPYEYNGNCSNRLQHWYYKAKIMNKKHCN